MSPSSGQQNDMPKMDSQPVGARCGLPPEEPQLCGSVLTLSAMRCHPMTRKSLSRTLGGLAAGLLLAAAVVPSPAQAQATARAVGGFGNSAAVLQTAQAQAQTAPAAQAPGQKPNILFIMGDDIGFMQPRIYHRGLMVGETPNLDRIGNEGAIFMDYLAMQSCTSGRNAFF